MNMTIRFLASSAIMVCAGAYVFSASASPALGAGEVPKTKQFNVEFFAGGAQCGLATFTYDSTTTLWGTIHTGCAQSNPIPGIGIVVKKNWSQHALSATQPGPSCSTNKEMEFEETIVNAGGLPEGDIYFLNYPLVNGACWWEFGSQDGVTLKEVGYGTYNVVP
ncbi:MAG TPA: hypothetical protein VGF97_19710 [Rhizomicrobium sp.]|jgi:hypothetical protein